MTNLDVFTSMSFFDRSFEHFTRILVYIYLLLKLEIELS